MRKLASAVLASLVLLSGNAASSLVPGCESDAQGTLSEPFWHEVAHTMVDPLTVLYRDQVRRSERLMEPIRGKMAEQGCTSWEAVVSEHIVRALVIERMRREQGEEAAREAAQLEAEAGFIYVPVLVKWLEQYGQGIDQKLQDHYPVLLKVLESRAAAQSSGRFQPAWQVMAAGRKAGPRNLRNLLAADAGGAASGRTHAGNERAAQAELLDLENRMMHAFQDKDPRFLERILGDDFLLTSARSSGERIGKRQFIDRGLSLMQVESFRFHDVSIRIFESTAVVNARLDWKSTWAGERFDADFLMTDVWVRSGGAWEIVSRHSSYPATRRGM